MSEYKLAVIIPCWNCCDIIRETLESIISQDYDDYRVFCVDDQSTDDTLSVLMEYSNKYSNINYLVRDRQPKGAQTCRNIGLDLSVGAEYVIWFDSDDIIAPYCFSQRVSFMDKHQDLDFGVFPAKTFHNDLLDDPDGLYGYRYEKQNDLRRFLRRSLPYVVWNNIYRRSSVIKHNLRWDENILSLQDSDFNIQGLLKGLVYDYCDDANIDYFYRVSSNGSISKKIFTKAHKDSHLYYLDKLHSSLSYKQQKDFALELDDYLFFFIDRFSHDKSFVFSIIKKRWLRRRVFFCLRIILYCLLRKRGKHILFPKICSYRLEDDKATWNYQQKVIEKKMKQLKNIYKSQRWVI